MRWGEDELDMPKVQKSSIISTDHELYRAAHCLKAMSHPIRLKILCRLGKKELTVQEIVDRVGTTQSNISQHLSVLRAQGILGCRKESNRVYYRIDDCRTIKLIRMIRDVYCTVD